MPLRAALLTPLTRSGFGCYSLLRPNAAFDSVSRVSLNDAFSRSRCTIRASACAVRSAPSAMRNAVLVARLRRSTCASEAASDARLRPPGSAPPSCCAAALKDRTKPPPASCPGALRPTSRTPPASVHRQPARLCSSACTSAASARIKAASARARYRSYSARQSTNSKADGSKAATEPGAETSTKSEGSQDASTVYSAMLGLLPAPTLPSRSPLSVTPQPNAYGKFAVSMCSPYI